MKIIANTLFLALCIYTSPIYSQKTDSVDILKEIKKIESEINKIHQNSIIQNLKNEKTSEDIGSYYKNQLKELSKLHILLEKNSEEIKTIRQVLSELDTASTKNTKKIKNFEMRNHAVQFILLGLLIFLIVFVIRFRRQSLDYLLLKANSLANQNDKIIEKAEELNTIKTTLNNLIGEQKKKEKEEKKSSQKKKKKK